jgi:hypothetical protein
MLLIVSRTAQSRCSEAINELRREAVRAGVGRAKPARRGQRPRGSGWGRRGVRGRGDRFARCRLERSNVRTCQRLLRPTTRLPSIQVRSHCTATRARNDQAHAPVAVRRGGSARSPARSGGALVGQASSPVLHQQKTHQRHSEDRVDRGEARRARRAGPAGASAVGRGRTAGKQRMRRSCGAICRIVMPCPTADVVRIVLP